MKISIVGTGYVGLTTAVILAKVGYTVYTIDIDEKKLDTIRGGKAHFYEPGLDDLVAEAIESGKMIPTSDYAEAIPESEIAMLTVGTPSNPDGSVDLKFIKAAAQSISKHMQDGLIVATKSTVPVGTGRIVQDILKGSGKDFHVLSNPEFLAEGSAVLDTFNMDRIVVGGDDQQAIDKYLSVFKEIDDHVKDVDLEDLKKYAVYRKKVTMHSQTSFKERVARMGLESAELVKVTANAFLATKISFANSIARLCDLTGADISEVMDGVGMDTRIGRDYLYAGLGWGGGCFPKDIAGLIRFSKDQGFEFEMLEKVSEINFSQATYVVEKAENLLDGLKERRVAVWGLSFKPGTSDIRKSPALDLVNRLLGKGVEVVTYDPQAMDEVQEEHPELNGKIEFAESAEAAVDEAELLILATDWPEFLDIDFQELKDQFASPNIIDARNRLNKEMLESLGYKYMGIGS